MNLTPSQQLTVLANRPGEPDFTMKLSPDRIAFPYSIGPPIYIDITVVNTTSEKQTFKVKCTSLEFFRVQPPIGIIEPKETVKIRIWLQNTTNPELVNQRHYFAFYQMKWTVDAITIGNSKSVWTNPSNAPVGVRRVLVTFGSSRMKPSTSAKAPAPPPK